MEIGPIRELLDHLTKTHNECELQKLEPIVRKINELESKFESLSDLDLRGKTTEFRERLDRGETLDDILPEAFATVRETSKRTLGLRHHDVQLMGGIVMHQGKIAEMKTGEGKTLVAALPLYLNALTGKGVHLVTANDYLAKRDSRWMGQIYEFLDVSVGCLQNGDTTENRKKAYRADITYGTETEFGFDYLRDNMVYRLEDKVQHGHKFAILDEVDNTLIDKARAPLIMTGLKDKESKTKIDLYKLAQAVEGLKKNHYRINKKDNTVTLRKSGVKHLERNGFFFNSNEPEVITNEQAHISTYVEQALKAKLKIRDKDYIIKEDKIIIIDQSTGRQTPGKTWSDGLHQAVEAKEKLKITKETVTHSMTTIQNYFRMYKKLAGMTGTAKTESEEFNKVYGLEVLVIPPNEKSKLETLPDELYKTKEAKTKAIVEDVLERHAKGQPILVGTTSITESEKLAELLKEKGIQVSVLHAKNHADESRIIAKAGEFGAVTISTNMAGRGVDIKLGGELAEEIIATVSMVLKNNGINNPYKLSLTEQRDELNKIDPSQLGRDTTEINYFLNYCQEMEKVKKLGGLHVIGIERYESRRIDDQLRGRAARQGDPGSSQFYLSLEDDLLKMFGDQSFAKTFDRFGIPDGAPLSGKMVDNFIEDIQTRIEGSNFDIRKHLLEYDDVLGTQRQHLFEQRDKVLAKEDLNKDIWYLIKQEIQAKLEETNKKSTTKDLLVWLEKIQPDLFTKKLNKDPVVVFPSFTNQVLLDEIDRSTVNANINTTMENLLERVCKTNGTDMESGVVNEVRQNLSKEIQKENVSKMDLIKVISDKLDCTHLASQLLSQKTPKKELGSKILDHLKKAERSQTKLWKSKEMLNKVHRIVLLRSITQGWIEHLANIDALRTAVSLTAYGQRDPLVEFKKLSTDKFKEQIATIRSDTVESVFTKLPLG